MNDHPGIDRASPEALIDALREEIGELEGIDDDSVPELPAGVLALLAQTDAQPRLAAALDDLIAADDPISDELAARIRTGTKSIQADQGTTLRFLEQIVTHARAGRDLLVSDIASHISASDDVIVDIEQGRAAFDRLEERQVAEWIDFLDINLDSAVDALRRSLASPATAYGGDSHTADRADDFVRGVEEILRSGTDTAPPA